MADHLINELKEKVTKKINELSAEQVKEMDVSYEGLMALTLKEVMALPYFKDTYDFLKIFELDNEVYIGNSMLNGFPNIHLESKRSHLLDFAKEEGKGVAPSEKMVNSDEWKNAVEVLSDADQLMLKEFQKAIEQSNGIGDIVSFSRNNPEIFYKVLKTFSAEFFEAIQLKEETFLRALVDAVGELSNEKENVLKMDFLRDMYNEEEYGVQFKKRYYGASDPFRKSAKNHNAPPKGTNLVLGEYVNAGVIELFDVKPNDIEGRIVSELNETDFYSVLTGATARQAMRNHKKFLNYERESNLEEKYVTFQRRQTMLEQLKGNKVLYDKSLLKLLKEYPMEKREEIFYDALLFQKDSQQFMKKLDDVLNYPTQEQLCCDEYSVQIINDVVSQLKQQFPSLSLKETERAKNVQFETMEVKEKMEVQNVLANEDRMHFYGCYEQDLGARQISFYPREMMGLNSASHQLIVWGQNELEVVGVACFEDTSLKKGVKTLNLQHKGCAHHFNDEDDFNYQFDNYLMNVMKENKAVVKLSVEYDNNISSSFNLLKQSLTDDATFMFVDSKNVDELGAIYFANEAMKQLNSRFYFNVKTNEDLNASFDALMEMKNTLRDWIIEKDWDVLTCSDKQKKGREQEITNKCKQLIEDYKMTSEPQTKQRNRLR